MLRGDLGCGKTVDAIPHTMEKMKDNSPNSTLYLPTYANRSMREPPASGSGSNVSCKTSSPPRINLAVYPSGSLYARSMSALSFRPSNPRRSVSDEPGIRGKEDKNFVDSTRSKFPSEEPRNMRCNGGRPVMSEPSLEDLGFTLHVSVSLPLTSERSLDMGGVRG